MQDAILIGSTGLGKGDDTLGNLIMANFLRLLSEKDEKPRYLLFWNSGVLLLTETFKALPYLQALQTAGVENLGLPNLL
jgi:hypothetical protein